MILNIHIAPMDRKMTRRCGSLGSTLRDDRERELSIEAGCAKKLVANCFQALSCFDMIDIYIYTHCVPYISLFLYICICLDICDRFRIIYFVT